MEETGRRVFGVCLVFFMFMPAFCQCFLFAQSGQITTPGGKTHFYVSENLTVTCESYAEFKGNATWIIMNKNVTADCIMTQINKTHASLMKLVTPGDPETAMFECIDSGRDVFEFLVQKEISTDYPPRNASNLQVIFLDKNSLEFSFDFGSTQFKNNLTYAVTAEWSKETNNAVSHWTACPNVTSLTMMNCRIDTFVDSNANVCVRVNITHLERQDTVSTVFPRVPVRDRAKPSPVSTVNVVPLSSRSVNLSLALTSDRHTMNYKITYSTSSAGSLVNESLETGMTENKTFVIQSLHPSYKYRFQVQAKFETGIWSDVLRETVTEITMPEAAPSSGPVLLHGAYSFEESACTDRSSVYIYYQEVAPEDQNGVILNYTAKVTTTSGEKMFVQTRRNIHTLKLDRMPCRESFNVSVYAYTDGGPSPVSQLTVHAYNSVGGLIDALEQIDWRIRYEPDTQKVAAEWTTDFNRHNLTVFYCAQDGIDPKQCQGNIQHVTLSDRKEEVILPSATVDMNFGMAAFSAQGGTASGIHFADCIYDTSKESPGEVPTVSANPFADHIKLTWTMQRCSSNRRWVVLQYEIKVCIVEHEVSSDCRNYTTDGKNSNYVLTQVSRETNYSVSLRAKTTTRSPWTASSAVTYVALPTAGSTSAVSDPGTIAGISIAVLLMVLVCGTILACYCRRRFKKMEKHFSSEIVESIPANVFSVDEKHGDPRNGSAGFVDAPSDYKAVDTTQTATQPSTQLSQKDSGFDQNDMFPLLENSGALPASYSRVTAPDSVSDFLPQCGMNAVIGAVQFHNNSARESPVDHPVFSVNCPENPSGQSPKDDVPPYVTAALTDSVEKLSTSVSSLATSSQGMDAYVKVTHSSGDRAVPSEGDSSSVGGDSASSGEDLGMLGPPVASLRYVSPQQAGQCVMDESSSDEDSISAISGEDGDSAGGEMAAKLTRAQPVNPGYVEHPTISVLAASPESAGMDKAAEESQEVLSVMEDREDGAQAPAKPAPSAFGGYVPHPYVDRHSQTDEDPNNNTLHEDDADVSSSASGMSSWQSGGKKSSDTASHENETSDFGSLPSSTGLDMDTHADMTVQFNRQDSGYMSPSPVVTQPQWGRMAGDDNINKDFRTNICKDPQFTQIHADYIDMNCPPLAEGYPAEQTYVGSSHIPAVMKKTASPVSGYVDAGMAARRSADTQASAFPCAATTTSIPGYVQRS